MTRDKIKEILKGLVKSIVEGEMPPVEESSLLIDTFGMDSLDKIDLWLKMEDKFKIDIPEHEIRACNTVGEILDLIEEKMKGKL